MKKIERKYPIGTFGYTEGKNETCHGFVYVKELDLDQLEGDIEELLKALIEVIIKNEANNSPIESLYMLVERLTGQEWQELKEMK